MILKFCLLFHHNLKSFFGWRELIILFISAPVIGIIFILGKLLGNESFKNEMASHFSNLCMFNLSEVVRNKLLKLLATVVLFFSFPIFTSEEGTCLIACILPISFFIMLHVVFILL